MTPANDTACVFSSIMKDFSCFLELEREFSNNNNEIQVSEAQKKNLLKAEFNYEMFRYDFDLSCRFIFFLTRLERDKFSNLHVILLKYCFVLSTFLKNRSSTKLKLKNESLLERAADILAADSRILLSSLPSKVDAYSYDAGMMFITFALVNIYEIIKGTKSSNTHGAAHAFLCNDFSLQASEISLTNYSSRMADFEIVGESFDQTVASKAFKYYNTESRLEYRYSFTSKHLLWFCIYTGIVWVLMIVFTEIFIQYQLKGL